MYIKLSTLGFLCLGIIAAAALIYLIILIHKLIIAVSKVNSILDKNENNISKFINNLPAASENLCELTDNFKLVSQVVTVTTASAIETKDNIAEFMSIAKDIMNIIKVVFKKD